MKKILIMLLILFCLGCAEQGHEERIKSLENQVINNCKMIDYLEGVLVESYKKYDDLIEYFNLEYEYIPSEGYYRFKKEEKKK